MARRSQTAPTSDPREQRRVYGGSTYWLRKVSGYADVWVVTGDGVALGAPTSYALALAGLDAVAPREVA